MTITELDPLKQVEGIFEKHKEQLSSSVRYERYRTTESLQRWVDLLGPDVLALTHPHATSRITEDFIAFNSSNGITLSEDQKTLLSLTPWVHDLGELILDGDGVGDISYEFKTDEHEKKEVIIFQRVISDLSDRVSKTSMDIAYREIAMSRETLLGRMFNAIERIGYLSTAMRAFIGVDGERIVNWKGLVGNVLSNQIEPLLAYSNEYPYVKYVLENNKQLISQMLAAVLEGDVPMDKDSKPSYDPAKVQKSAVPWRSF